MKFTKMQGTGNDFILIDAHELERDWPCLAMVMCRRHFGVGADGLILVLDSKVADFRMRIFNADGSEAEMCGNGLRCFAKYVVEQGLAPEGRRELAVETLAGINRVRPRLEAGVVTGVQVGMGVPQLKPNAIPVLVDKAETLDVVLDYPLVVDGRELKITCVSMGNPHAVCFVDEPVADFPLTEVGPKVEHHPIFPQRVNFEVARVVSRRQVEARVWERGVGETLSCGSGASAIAVAARLHDFVDDELDITLPGGVLTLAWDGAGEVLLSGPAEAVFWGEWVEKVG
jgi:diaminopimelate epimerase